MTEPVPTPPPVPLPLALRQLRYVARMAARRDVRLVKLRALALAGRAIRRAPIPEAARVRLRRRLAARAYRLAVADIVDTITFAMPGDPW